MARQVKRYIMRGLGRSVKVLSVGASIPEEDIAFPTWRLSAHPTVESLMEASSQRLDQLLSPFLLFSHLWRMEEGLEIPSFQPWLGPAGDQPHPGAPSRRGSGHEEVSRELGPLCQEPGAETSVAVSVISLCLCFCLFGLLLPLSLCCGGWMAEEPAPGLTGQVQSDGQRAGA